MRELGVPPPIYKASPSNVNDCLRQGEIVSDLIQARLAIESVVQNPVVDLIHHPLAIVLAQDCDLEQDFLVRVSGEVNYRCIPTVLFCEVISAAELYGRVAQNEKEWHRLNISKNKNERFHFLQRVQADCDVLGEGIDELGIDFKRYFAIPTDEVYRRIELGEARRRCVLQSPYLEHLSTRFAHYLSRIALPEDHASN